MEASRTPAGGTAAYSATRRDHDDDDLRRRGPDAWAAELIGTFLLVLFVGSIVSVHNADGLGVTDFAVIGLVHFFLLSMLIYSLGHASGAHFNPAVTVTLTALRKIGPIDAAIYIVLQLIGAILAAFVVKFIFDNEGEAVGYGATEISDKWLEGKVLGGFAVELIGTFVLMWAIMGVAVNPKGARDWAGFVIGGTLALAVMCFAPLTGAGFNPARALGPSLVGGGEPVGGFLVAYVLGPIVGALLAGVLYQAGILGPEGRTGRAPKATFGGVESRRDEGEARTQDEGETLIDTTVDDRPGDGPSGRL